MGAGSYTKEVASSHKRFQTAIRRAKTRQGVMNAYWKHKKDHERMLAKHLKEEMRDVNRIKSKIPHR
ncbi:MAG: hypothetical protein ACE5EJ_06290 [Nitrosopumilaceae archaeon]